jgi:CHAT domain-containing protein/DNA-binding XRE family transcriptional regulator
MIDLRLSLQPEQKVDLADARRAVLELTKSDNSIEAKAEPSGKEYLQLSQALLRRFDESKNKGDKESLSILEEAIDSAKKSVGSVSIGSKEHTKFLHHQVTLCMRKTDIVNDKEVMDETIKFLEKELDLSENESLFLKLNLCQLLRSRFLRFQDITDLNKASILAEEFIEPAKGDQGYDFEKVVIAGAVLKGKYQWLGDIGALDKGISALRQAVDRTSLDGELPQAENLINATATLAFMLRLRFRRTGTFEDIVDASNFGRSALNKLKKGGLSAGFAKGIKNNVAIILEDLFNRTRKIQDLEEAISLLEEIDDATGNINLANMLNQRFNISKNVDDLDRAARIAKDAVSMGQSLGVHYILLLSDSAEILLAKYKQSFEREYLDEAIKLAESSLGQISKENPWRANVLLMYGNMLYEKASSESATPLVGLKPHIKVHEEAWENEYGAPASRIRAAHQAAKFHCVEGNWTTASKLLEEAVAYISEVCPPWMDHKDRQHLLGDLSELPSNAATVALTAGKSPYQALRLLEMSRSVIMGSTIDIRDDVFHLAEVDPELEQRFNRVRMELDSASDKSTDFERRSKYSDNDFLEYGRQIKTHETVDTSGISHQKSLFQEMTTILASIRELPGLEDFLKPSKPETIVEMGKEGPIVYVMSSKITGGGNAIIAMSSGITAIDLPDLTAVEANERLNYMKAELTSGTLRTYAKRNKSFNQELLWLWEVVVKPVFAHIDPNFESAPSTQKMRIHWIGVGIFSCIPFHAAGDHSPGSTSNAISHSISSYGSSLRAFQYVMKPRLKGDLDDRFLITTMEETPGAARLISVKKEMLTIRSIIGEALPISSLEEPSPSQVLEQLAHHNLVHFACHGVSDPIDPFKSRLLLANPNQYRLRSDQTPGTLSVHDLLTHRSPRADLAYISACSTADIKVASLSDESIHIASGFQLAGFRHVVASLWGQKDSICLEIATGFYRELIRMKQERRMTPSNDWAAAEALHNAVSEIRSNRPEMPLQWASFVHIGW